MSKKGNPRGGFSAKEMEVLRRARREGKAVSFARGFPQVVDPPTDRSPNGKGRRHDREEHRAQIGAGLVELPAWSILGPITDLISMVGSLEMYASHYSEALSQAERRREDCTHALNPVNIQKCDNGYTLSDSEILAIGKKLQRIGTERRTIKNRFEILKLIKKWFESADGVSVLLFLETVAADVVRLQAEQKERHYKPRTNELDDLDPLSHQALNLVGVGVGGGDLNE